MHKTGIKLNGHCFVYILRDILHFKQIKQLYYANQSVIYFSYFTTTYKTLSTLKVTYTAKILTPITINILDVHVLSIYEC